MRKIENLSREAYEELKATGYLWEFYPEASGIYERDCESSSDDEKGGLSQCY